MVKATSYLDEKLSKTKQRQLEGLPVNEHCWVNLHKFGRRKGEQIEWGGNGTIDPTHPLPAHTLAPVFRPLDRHPSC